MSETDAGRMRDVLSAAFAQCRACNDDEVDTAHLLLCVLADAGPAATLLAREISVAAVRRQMDRRGGLGRELALTPRAERALHDADQLRGELRHGRLTVTHLVMALLRPDQDRTGRRPWWHLPPAPSAAVQILRDVGVDLDRVYQAELAVARDYEGDTDVVHPSSSTEGGAEWADDVAPTGPGVHPDPQTTPGTGHDVLPSSLYRYLRHDPSCELQHGCGCGLDAALSHVGLSSAAFDHDLNRTDP